jgi:hypothetical protein
LVERNAVIAPNTTSGGEFKPRTYLAHLVKPLTGRKDSPLKQTHPPKFGAVLRTHLIDADIVTRMGNPSWMEFVEQLPGITYESLRKAIVGERPPSEKILLATAQALGVSPTVFTGYRLLEARRALDPSEVGWNRAVKALQKWEAGG